MTGAQIADRRAAIAAERAALEAELARRETLGLMFLKPGVPLNPAELADFQLSHPKEKSS